MSSLESQQAAILSLFTLYVCLDHYHDDGNVGGDGDGDDEYDDDDDDDNGFSLSPTVLKGKR